MAKVRGKVRGKRRKQTSYRRLKKREKKSKKIIKRDKIQESNERIIEAQYAEDNNITYRYSIAYFNSNYDKTFRAEVYTKEKFNESSIKAKLDSFLRNRIAMQNKGLQRLFYSSYYVGFEAEEVGINDVGQSQLNRMTFWID